MIIFNPNDKAIKGKNDRETCEIPRDVSTILLKMV